VTCICGDDFWEDVSFLHSNDTKISFLKGHENIPPVGTLLQKIKNNMLIKVSQECYLLCSSFFVPGRVLEEAIVGG
jgi:hypothetical protein